jgi:hypothetical protein
MIEDVSVRWNNFDGYDFFGRRDIRILNTVVDEN